MLFAHKGSTGNIIRNFEKKKKKRIIETKTKNKQHTSGPHIAYLYSIYVMDILHEEEIETTIEGIKIRLQM